MPMAPIDAKAGLPWFDNQSDLLALDGAVPLKHVTSIAQAWANPPAEMNFDKQIDIDRVAPLGGRTVRETQE